MKKNKWLILLMFLFVLSLPFYVKSNRKNTLLNGIRVVIDAGHGKPDMGASAYEIDEAPLNLQLSLKLKKSLENLGCHVILTRENENDLAENNAVSRKKKDMEKRIQIINDEKNDFFISLHINKFDNESVKGLHVFYDSSKSFSLELAQSIQNALNQSVKQEKQIKRGDFYLFNHSRISGVLIECGFLSNQNDRENLQSENYQNQIIEAITQGIIDCLDHQIPFMI